MKATIGYIFVVDAIVYCYLDGEDGDKMTLKYIRKNKSIKKKTVLLKNNGKRGQTSLGIIRMLTHLLQ